MTEVVKKEITPVKRAPGPYGITHENARAMAQRGWDMRREKAAEGMKEAVEEVVGKLVAGEPADVSHLKTEAWKQVIKRATEVYMKSDNIRGMSEMASFIGKSTGMIREQSKEEQVGNDNQLLGIEDAKIVLNVFNYYNTDYQNEIDEIDVIDAEASDLFT